MLSVSSEDPWDILINSTSAVPVGSKYRYVYLRPSLFFRGYQLSVGLSHNDLGRSPPRNNTLP